jgi:hypothetical protein
LFQFARDDGFQPEACRRDEFDFFHPQITLQTIGTPGAFPDLQMFWCKG